MNTLKFGNGEWYGKKDTILAYNDLNSNFKPLAFNFDRASSATVINKDGLIETVGSGEPRIDYKDDSKGALLLEPSRSNLVTYSEDFSQSYWTKARLTATSNSVISPDGTLNASKIFGDGSNSWKYINRNGFSLINTNYYTFSVFAKADTLNYIQLIASGATAENYQNFDLLNGVIGSGSGIFNAKIEAFVNGWYKCSMTVLATSTATTDLFINLADSATMSRAGSFLTSGGVYIYGAQLEQGSYPTSIIPTSGGVVTRVQDVCNNGANEQVINSTEGVLYIEADILKTSGTGFLASISNGLSLSESINIRQQSSGVLSFQLSSGGSNTFINTTDWSEGINKIALRYNSNGINVYINGNSKGTNSAINYPNMNNLDLASRPDQVGQLIELIKVKDVRVYNTALTDAELQALTTI